LTNTATPISSGGWEDIEVGHFEARCPACKGHEVLLVRGTEELKLIEMDVE